MKELFANIFGGQTAAQAAPSKFNAALAAIGSAKQADDSHYDALAQSYAAHVGTSMHKSIAALQNSTALGHMNALRQNVVKSDPPAPEPKDIPALAISLDVAYDLWAAKHGYDWVNINAVTDTHRLYQHQRYSMGLAASQLPQPGAWAQAQVSNGFTVSVDTAEPPEPEFDWYTVARRLVHVRALENEGGYYRLVPKEWFK